MNETKKIIIFGILIVILITVLLFVFLKTDKQELDKVMTLGEYKIYIIDELIREEYNDDILGYDANTLISVFGGLKNEDFDGLDTGYGVYEIIDGGIVFRPSEGLYEETKSRISNEKVLVLFNKVAKRINQPIDTREGFEQFIMKIKQ